MKPTRCRTCGIVERAWDTFEDGLCYRCVREAARGANMVGGAFEDFGEMGRPEVVLMLKGKRIVRYHG